MRSSVAHDRKPAGVFPAAWWLVAGFGVLVTLSGVQLWMRAEALGQSPSFGSVFTRNLVASLPWLPLAGGILWLTFRRPPDRPRGLLLHALTSVTVATCFLAWLALFHLQVTGGALSARLYVAWLRLDLAEFFTLALVLYWLIVAVGLALRASRELRRTRRRVREARRRVAEESAAGQGPASRLVIRSLGRSRLVDPKTIDWIEAQGSYVRLHTATGSHLLREALGEIAERLEDAGFARIHRSTVVNLARVTQVRPLSHGEALVVLDSGLELKVSRTFRDALDRLGL